MISFVQSHKVWNTNRFETIKKKMIKGEGSDNGMSLLTTFQRCNQPVDNDIKIVEMIDKDDEKIVNEKAELLEDGEILDDDSIIETNKSCSKEVVHFVEKSSITKLTTLIKEASRNKNQEYAFDDGLMSDDGMASTSCDSTTSASDDILDPSSSKQPPHDLPSKNPSSNPFSNQPLPALPLKKQSSSLSRKFKKDGKHNSKGGSQLCKYFREGHCHHAVCRYSHNASDSRRYPQLCNLYLNGICQKGLNCNLFHGEFPCKNFQYNNCHDSKCRFSHQPLDKYTQLIFKRALEEERLTNFISLPPFSQSNGLLPQSFDRDSSPMAFNSDPSPLMKASPAKLPKLLNQRPFHQSDTPYSRPSSMNFIQSRDVTIENLLSTIDEAFDGTTMHNSC